MSRVALDLGIIKIYWYSITMLIAVAVGLFLTYKEIKKQGIDTAFFTNMAFYTIIFGFVGARIYYVLFNLEYYTANPLEIIQIYKGGLAIHGAIISGIITVIYYCKKYKKSFLKILDICSIGIIIGQVIGRWGNFFNQEAHGIVTTLETLKSQYLPQFIIEGMKIDGLYYYPTFLYESIYNFIGLIIILVIRRKLKLKEGQLVSIYLVYYSIGRLFIEQLRTDSLMLGTIRVAQLISILLIILGITLFIKCSKNKLYQKENV